MKVRFYMCEGSLLNNGMVHLAQAEGTQYHDFL